MRCEDPEPDDWLTHEEIFTMQTGPTRLLRNCRLGKLVSWRRQRRRYLSWDGGVCRSVVYGYILSRLHGWQGVVRMYQGERYRDGHQKTNQGERVQGERRTDDATWCMYHDSQGDGGWQVCLIIPPTPNVPDIGRPPVF